MDILVPIEVSETFPDVTAIQITPDVVGFVYITFIGGTQEKISMAILTPEDELTDNILTRLGLIAA